MAIVKTYHYPNGTVHIADDAYKDATPEELKAREETMYRVANEIWLNAWKREQAKKKAEAQADAQAQGDT